jgi:hypothetical protein
MTPTIRVVGLDKVGVTLITAASSGFEADVRKEAGQWADAALLASPQLVIIRNASPHTIVAYAISFKSTRPDGRWDFHHIEFKYPDAVATTDPDTVRALRSREIRPSEQRLVTRFFEIDPRLDNSWLPQMINVQNKDLQRFAGPRGFAELEIAIDAVIFEDGRLLGPDQSQVETRFQLLLQHKQELYRAAAALMASGKSVSEALAIVKSRQPSGVGQGTMADDDGDNAMGEALLLLNKYGEERTAAVIEHAVRSIPFTVRKTAAEQ